MSYKRPKPVKVKNISPKVIWYGNARQRPGKVFYITDPTHFSKVGSMVQIDEETGKEIRHLGGYKEINGRWKSMKGEPVAPLEDVMQPTEEEIEEARLEEEYQERLAELNKQYKTQRAPVPAKPVVKTAAEIIEDKQEEDKKDSSAPQPDVLGSDEVATAVSNQQVI